MRRFLRPLLSYLLIGCALIALATCAKQVPETKPQSQTGSPQAEPASESDAEESVALGIVFEDAAPLEVQQAFVYSKPPNPYYFKPWPDAAPDAGEQAIYAEIRQAMQSRRGVEVAADANLLMASRETARYVLNRSELPPTEMIRETLLWAGVGESNPLFFFHGRRPDEDPAVLSGRLNDWIAGLDGGARMNRLAVGIAEAKDENGLPLQVVAVIGVMRFIELQPFSKETPYENRFIARGRCVEPPCELKYYIQFMDEAVHQGMVETERDGLMFEVLIPPAPAVYHLDLTQVIGEQERIVLSCPIYHQMPQPLAWTPTVEKADCENPAECERMLEAAIQGIRQSGAVAPLLKHKTISAVARAHADTMLANHVSSIYDRQGRDARMRLLDAGLPVFQAGELVGGAYTMAEMIRQIETSASQVAFLRKEGTTHLGCGVAIKVGPTRSYYAVSCVTATIIDAREGEPLRKALMNAFNAQRKAVGKAAFGSNDLLQSIADRAIERIMKDPEKAKKIQQDVREEIEFEEVIKGRSRFGIFTVYAVEQVGLLPVTRDLIDSKFTHLVLGVRKQIAPDAPLKGIFVYYIAYQ